MADPFVWRQCRQRRGRSTAGCYRFPSGRKTLFHRRWNAYFPADRYGGRVCRSVPYTFGSHFLCHGSACGRTACTSRHFAHVYSSFYSGFCFRIFGTGKISGAFGIANGSDTCFCRETHRNRFDFWLRRQSVCIPFGEKQKEIGGNPAKSIAARVFGWYHIEYSAVIFPSGKIYRFGNQSDFCIF